MKDHIAHSGAWGLALIIIVIASWLLCRYLAPKTWKEFGEYRNRVPMFIPRWGQWRKLATTRSEKQAWEVAHPAPHEQFAQPWAQK